MNWQRCNIKHASYMIH